MRGGIFLSLVFHSAVAIVAYLGLPYLNPEPLISETPIFVDVVDVAEESNPSPPEPKPEPEEAKTPEPPPPEPAPVAEPKPEPEPEVASLPPEPEPAPKVEPKPEPKPTLAGIRPPEKPKPKPRPKPDWSSSVLKSLSKPQKPKPKPAPKPDDAADKKSAFEKSIAEALQTTSQKRHNPSLPVSMSETDAIRKHFQQCWNVPAGAKDAEGMVVELEIRFQQDGSVRSVQVLDAARMRADPFFRTSAEAAQRAVLHPKCNKLSMPAGKFPDWQAKYQKWRKITLVFDPKDMF